MAKRSDTPPATPGAGLQPPRSDAPDNNPPTDVSPAPNASQKRGRGRPPKSKSDSQPNGAVSAQPARKPSARPKRNAAAAVPAASTVVRSGRGRPKRSNTLTATASPVTGSRKRGRPKKDDVAAAPAKKRGRKPKTEEAAKQRTSNRTRKTTTEATTGQGAADPREFKKKAALLQKKVKQAADKLKIAVSAIEEVQKIADGM
ncbi:hypothetical protein N665_0152s0027 [Sinapis alba]|nr:hypothetical protein N665_0152s0027 [Sinapis alba]KAF8105892.1 hypothetical protein N665_0152s0027 [Sinapis alba]